jgi:hypothetical protein
MRVYSAAEAVSPAVQRTQRFLFRPFEWGSYLKLAAIAAVSEGTLLSFNFSTGSSGSGNSTGEATALHLTAGWIAAIALGAALSLLVGIYLFYLITRLRFALFHCLVYQVKEIGPGWRRYRAQAMRLFKLNLLVWLGLAIVGALAVLPFAPTLLKLVEAHRDGEPMDVGGMIVLFLLLGLIVFVLAIVFVAADAVLHDFILPRMALEDASAGDAWRGARALIDAEPGSVCFYLFLRMVLPLFAMIGLFLVALIPTLVVVGVLGMGAMEFRSLLEDATGVGEALRVSLAILFGLVGLSFCALLAVGLGGPLGICIRNYALLFYGGRYAALGDLLSPPPAAVLPSLE